MKNYKIIKTEKNSEIDATVTLAEHEKTGAQLLSIANGDDNKVFGITFKTPVSDSRGIPHILEHSVLCGSEKYPLKEPFTEMIKSSLQTFLNAFTYPDRTCYPVASQNKQDFINLVRVYLDAVFKPLLGESVLKQEGWHYELEDEAGPLSIQGVVYNEMKGAYSDPLNQLSDCINETLYSNSQYVHDSGGNPAAIPDLDYAAFKGFYDKFYQPSNALIYFYGDFPVEEQVEILEEYLSLYERSKVDAEITIQERFNELRSAEYYFDSGEDDADEKSMHTLNWLMSECLCPLKRAEYVVLDYLLLGSSSAVLKKALMESKLGETVIGGGLQNYLREMSFSVGLKGIPYNKIGELSDLIKATLAEVEKTPFRQSAKEAALNSIEFSLRENNTGSTPRGLVLMQRVLNTWVYGADPVAAIRNQDIIDHIAKCIKEPGYFEKLLKDSIIDNSHMAIVTLRPKSGLQNEKDLAEKESLAKLLESLNSEQKQNIIKETAELKAKQEELDSPEVLKLIPSLKISDIDPKIKKDTLEKTKLLSQDCSVYATNTNGIIYFELLIDIKNLDQELLPFMPIYSQALFELGTKQYSYEEFAETIDRTIGATWAYPWVSSLKQSGDFASYFFLRGKALKRQVGDLFNIWKAALFELDLDNRDRFLQLVKQRKARLEAAVVPSGHRFALSRMHSHLHPAGLISEKWSGISQLQAIREVEKQVESNWAGVQTLLKNISVYLNNLKNVRLHITCDEENKQFILGETEKFLGNFNSSADIAKAEFKHKFEKTSEGFAIPARVNYVGRSGLLYESGYKFHPSIMVISHMIRTSYLWNQVRVLGGAYGCFCSFDRFTGTLDFVSYRDPHVERTLNKYAELAEYLEKIDLSEDELQKGIIGVIGNLDSPELPDAKGCTLLTRELLDIDDEERQYIRTGILNTKLQDFKDLGTFLRKYTEQSLISVVGPKEKISELGDKLKIHELF